MKKKKNYIKITNPSKMVLASVAFMNQNWLFTKLNSVESCENGTH